MADFFRRKDVLLFLLLVAMLHILVTFLVSSRVGRARGTLTAGIIAGSLTLADDSEQQGLQEMPAGPEEETPVYRSILFLLSLPFDPIMRPVYQRWAVRPALEGKIQVGEYTFRANLIGTATRVLNAIVFSLLVFWCFRSVTQRMKGKGK